MEEKLIATEPQGMIVADRQPLQRQDGSELDLVEVFVTLAVNWKAVLMAFLVGATLLGIYHSYMVVPTYQATTDIYITSSSSMISLQDLQIGSALTQDYQSIIMSRQVLNKVIRDLDLNVNYNALKKMIGVSNPSGTHIIRTRVTTGDLTLSRDIANDLLLVSKDRIYEIIGTGNPTIIEFSEAEAVEDVTPSIVRYMLIGGVVGVVLVAVFLIARMLMDTTIKSDDDVERYLQLPILSAVPYFRE